MSDSTRIGATVAGYRIQSLIGRGGMSIVYLAEHVQLGRQVALKLLAPVLSADSEFRERFAHESRRAAEVDHPNVVPIFDAGEADGQLFIAMRYIEGCDLKTLIGREGALGIGRTLFILEQAADGLDAAHDRNLIHRDVKPANILVAEPSEHVYLTDFGVVKHTAAQGFTRTGFFIGTVDYAAPEQIEGKTVDARTDVYALGCVLYECLAGQAPFEREGEMAVMHAHLVQPPPVLSSALPMLPKGLDAVVARAMAKAQDDRYATCGDLVAAARHAALERRSRRASAKLASLPQPPVADSGATADAEEPAPAAVELSAPSDAAVPLAAAAAVPTPPAEASARGERRGGPSLALIVGVAVVAALASGFATYLATRGSASSNLPSTLNVTTTTATATAENERGRDGRALRGSSGSSREDHRSRNREHVYEVAASRRSGDAQLHGDDAGRRARQAACRSLRFPRVRQEELQRRCPRPLRGCGRDARRRRVHKDGLERRGPMGARASRLLCRQEHRRRLQGPRCCRMLGHLLV